ncbi:SlyX family protein [Desulfopila aestuarii]|uniref:SlyX protein n=1 Tax=Desulfopila aestuarii DSM 18488 TaxID=1121416 RepID=A0A1M7YBL1_9BACT|nr:SlyX family protein [Desulfopila aestuarii]SHO49908.1 SlyX protein [Desulfopila aestuarii DSM 18488]
MSSELEARIRTLEEKFEYQDHTVETLNQVIIRQQAQIDTMQEELKKLREDVMAASLDTGDIVSEKPPHY